LLNFKGDKAEAQGVAALVTWLWKVKGVPPSEILVLSRTDRYGTFTKAIKEELSNRGIPISDPSLVETVLAESSNRRLLAILRLLVQSADSLAWWSLLSLQEHVGDAFIDYAFNTSIASTTTFAEAFLAAANADFAGAPSASRSAARALWQEVSSLLQAIELPTQEEGLAWGKWILDQIESGRLPNCSDQLKNLLIEIDGAVEANVELRRYLSQIHPLGVDLMRARSDGARFMTMTGSKGLTVRATIVVGVDNDLIPRPDVDPAEERRLLYVAMTRSRE
jgi:superfamily I DNA/RNA helicase